MADLVTFSQDVARRLMLMLHRAERGLDDTPNRKKRRPIDDGGGGCDSQNAKIQWTVLGKPTGGTFTCSLTINSVAETITFNWDDDATEVDTALATHSELAGSDVTVTGGPFPNATIEVEFVGTQALTNIALPTSNWGSLTGGSGVAVITSLSQLGHA